MLRPSAALLLLAAFAAVPAVLTAPPLQAKDDQEQARKAVESGEIRPLDEVLAAARKAVPGDVVKLDLKRDHGRWLYKLKILSSDGKRHEVEVDAKTLAILEDDDDD